MSTELKLGQHVKYRRSIYRRDLQPGEFLGSNKIWTSVLYPGKETEGGEGIVIGKRTLSNGNVDIYGYDEPAVYRPKEHFTAYLIAYDLRRRPVHVLPEDVTSVEQP